MTAVWYLVLFRFPALDYVSTDARISHALSRAPFATQAEAPTCRDILGGGLAHSTCSRALFLHTGLGQSVLQKPMAEGRPA